MFPPSPFGNAPGTNNFLHPSPPQIASLLHPMMLQPHHQNGGSNEEDPTTQPIAPKTDTSGQMAAQMKSILKNESEEMIEELMEALSSELDRIDSKPAYENAIREDISYPTNRDFRLSFLRAECYNPKMAASRMVLYFETKQSLFGPAMIAKRVTFEDLDDDVQDLVLAGSMTVLPQRDPSGRYVYVSSEAFHPNDLMTPDVMVSKDSDTKK